jgi:hypothetical protein
MISFRPLLAGDLVQLKLQPSQHLELGIEEGEIDMQRARDLVLHGPGWTAHEGGRILCCAGFRETFPPVQAVAWAMLARDIGPKAHLAITRYAREEIRKAPYRRLEALVEADNNPAVMWAKLVGLHAAHRLECFGFDSAPHILFERIRL